MYINIYHASCPTLESVSRRPTPHNSVQPHEAVTRAIGQKEKKNLNARDDEQEEQSIGGCGVAGPSRSRSAPYNEEKSLRFCVANVD